VRVNDGAPQVGPWVRLDLVEDHAVDDLAKPRCISELDLGGGLARIASAPGLSCAASWGKDCELPVRG